MSKNLFTIVEMYIFYRSLKKNRLDKSLKLAGQFIYIEEEKIK